MIFIICRLLGILNFFILQWFHIRLSVVKRCTTGKFSGFCIIYNIRPMSGWFNRPPDRKQKIGKSWIFRK